MDDKILKAEVLVTRRCNLNCGYCKIPKNIPNEKELTLDQWKQAFKIVYNELGGSFIAIYGGEPLQLGKEGLGDIIEALSSYRPEKSYTIISNSIGLKDSDMDYFISRGLDSWTASVDSLQSGDDVDKYTRAKSNIGLQTLLKFKEKGLRDTCGIVTATRKNLENIPDIVQYLSDRGIWTGIDVLHYRKCDGQKGLPASEDMLDLLFKREDMPIITEVADILIDMKKKGALIFPTYQVLEGWKDPNNIVDLNWKCGTQSPYCITIDADGSLMECDSFQGSRIKNYNIFDLPNKWNSFKEDYMKDVAKECSGCFWSTHVCAKDMMEKGGVKYYQHETTKQS